MSQSAQKGIPEGRVFELNKQRLAAVGSRALQDMLDRRDWTGLPQYSAFALNKGTKTQSGIMRDVELEGEGDSDGDMEAEMDVRKGMEAYYTNNGAVEVVDEVEEGSDDYVSYRSIEKETLFEKQEQEEEEEEEEVEEEEEEEEEEEGVQGGEEAEVGIEIEVEDLEGVYSSYELNEEQEQEVEVEVEAEEEDDMSVILSSNLFNSSDDAKYQQGEEQEDEEEDQLFTLEDAVNEEVEEEVEVVEEEGEFDSLLLDVDRWLSEN